MKHASRDEPLRVLHLISRDQTRGAENVASWLAEALESDQTTNTVVALCAGPAQTPPLGAHRLTGGKSLRPGGLLRRLLLLRRFISRWRPDVILAHGGQASLHAVLVTRHIPVVWHRILELPSLNSSRRVIWGFVARRAAGAIAITDQLAAELDSLGHRGSVARIPNVRPSGRYVTLDHLAAKTALVAELRLHREATIIGFVAHLVPQKDPLLALETFRIVADEVPGCHLVVAGDGPLWSAFERECSAPPFADRVHLLGHRQDVPELLAAFDLLLVTSQSESMAGVTVEAAMAGCPVVTIDFDGAATVVRNGLSGQIVSTRSAGALALAASELLRDPERLDAMRVAARDAGTEFALERHLPGYQGLLQRVDPRHPHVLYVMPDIGVGGAEQALAVIAREHDRSSMTMSVAALRGQRRAEEETVVPALRHLAVPVLDLRLAGRADRSLRHLAIGALKLRLLCRRLRVDVVDSCLFEADLVSRLALVGSSIRHVVHLVNTPYGSQLDRVGPPARRWRREIVRRVDAGTAHLTDTFVAITDTVGKAAETSLRLDGDRIEVIGRGVDLAALVSLPMPPKPPLRLLSVGRLVPQKAHDTAIRALALARSRGIDAKLTIHGEGPLQAQLEALIDELGIAEHVALAGTTRDIVRAHRMHHAFVFPSRWEGQGNALLEALACARPVVVSDIPVFREVLGDVARFVALDDTIALASEIARLADLDDDDLEAEGRRSRMRAERAYDSKSRVKDLQRLYGAMTARS